MNKKWIEIFKGGKQTDSAGVEHDGDLLIDRAVASFNAQEHEPPVVIGHPKDDSPAWGWVEGLKREGDLLLATFRDVAPEFAALVKDGRYKKRSAAFYPDGRLRHVGFLGAVPPAVKGLAPIPAGAFAEGEFASFEFGQWEERTNAGLWRGLRDFLIGKFGLEEADRAIPDWEVDTLAEAAVKPVVKIEDSAAPMYAEGGPEGSHHNKEDRNMPTPEELAAKEASLKQQEASFAERETKLRAGERKALHQEHLAFAEGLVKEGKLLPAMKETAVALIDFAAGLDAVQQVVEFGEGEGKKSVPAAELFKEFLTSQPKVVEFSEIAKAEKEAVTAEFAAAPGFTVDVDSLELHNKAIAYQGAHPGVDYLAAVRAVS